MCIEILIKNDNGNRLMSKSVLGSNNHKSLLKAISWKKTKALLKLMEIIMPKTSDKAKDIPAE